jgi:hypothetical protein
LLGNALFSDRLGVCCPMGRSASSPPMALPKKQCRIVGGRIQNRLVRVELKPATFPFPRPRPDRNPAVQQSHAIVMCYRYSGGPAPRQASVHTSSYVTAQFRWRCRDFCLGFDFCDGSGHAQGPDLGGADWVFRGCQSRETSAAGRPDAPSTGSRTPRARPQYRAAMRAAAQARGCWS